MGCVSCCDFKQPFRQRRKQFGQAMVANHEVRHLQQSFVAPKVRVKLELVHRTQITRPEPHRQTGGL